MPDASRPAHEDIFDTSARRAGPSVVAALRTWNTSSFSTLVYTHGHVDHVGGSGAFAAAAVDRGDAAPTVVGHARVGARFDRYRLTNGYNAQINARQFGGRPPFFRPTDFRSPGANASDLSSRRLRQRWSNSSLPSSSG